MTPAVDTARPGTRPPQCDGRRGRIPSPAALLLALVVALTSGRAAAADTAESAADRQFTFAVRLLQRGESDLAREALEQFVRRHGDDRRVSDAHYYLALVAQRSGDLDGAHAHLQQVRDPLHVNEAALGLTRGQVKLQRGDAEGAVEALEGVDGERLGDREARAAWAYLLGQAYQRTGNLPAASRHFDRASEADSAIRARALLELGKVRAELDAEAAAVEALREALEAGLPSEQAAEARALAADLAYRQGQHARAADLYEQVLQRHQASVYFADAVTGLLRALYADGRYDQVASRYAALEETRARWTDQTHAEALYLLAAAHVRQEEYERAMQGLNRFLDRFGPDHALGAEVNYLYAICLYQTDPERFERWADQSEPLLGRSSHRHEVRYLRAQAAVRRDRPEEAVQHLDTLIQAQEPTHHRRALRQRAALLEQLGRTEAAADDYAEYARRYDREGDPADALEAQRRSILLAFRNRQFDRVVEMAEPWLEHAPADEAEKAAVRLQLAVALARLEREGEALEALQALLDRGAEEQVEAQAHYYRGRLLAAKARRDGGGFGPAVESLRAAAGGPLPETQRIEAMELVGRMELREGREREALAAYEWLRQRTPLDEIEPLTALWVGRALQEAEQDGDAQPWLRSVVDRDSVPSSVRAEALFRLGRTHQALAEWEEAVEVFRRLVAMSDGYVDRGRLGLARSLAETGRTAEALDEYAGLIDVEASLVAATALLEAGRLRMDLARRYERAGDRREVDREHREARRYLNRVVILYDVPQLEREVLEAQLQLALLEARAGRTEQARGHLQQILDREADAAWHRLARAERYLLDGSRSEALLLLRRVRDEGQGEAARRLALERLRQLGET